MNLIERLVKEKKASPPPWLPNNLQYVTLMGSTAYGVEGATSDQDFYGFCIPPKGYIFPHMEGHIFGFGSNPQTFGVWQEHHIKDGDEELDFSIYGIVRYFDLCRGCNPNMVDSLYTPDFCVRACTTVGQMVRRNRDLFLSKKAFHTFKGYAYQQKSKMQTKVPKEDSKRYEDFMKHGVDLKFMYHLVRLVDEADQILREGTIDLQRNREHLKAIRRGEVKLDDVEKWFSEKELQLEKLYHESKLPHQPREAEIKQLLLDCLEHHYGSLDAVIVREDRYVRTIEGIEELLAKLRASEKV